MGGGFGKGGDLEVKNGGRRVNVGGKEKGRERGEGKGKNGGSRGVGRCTGKIITAPRQRKEKREKRKKEIRQNETNHTKPALIRQKKPPLQRVLTIIIQGKFQIPNLSPRLENFQNGQKPLKRENAK